MKCPFCNRGSTRVIDSRPAEDNSTIRRRRECEDCGKRFTTYEKVERSPIFVIKKDRSRQAYDRNKIGAGISRSCYKRPIPIEKIEETITEIENEIFNLSEREIESTTIGELVMTYLKKLDEVAYVRFASVYREFKDITTFMDELQNLIKNN